MTMARRLREAASLLLGIASILVAFLIPTQLGFFVVYYAAMSAPGLGMPGRSFLHELSGPLVMAILAGLTVAAGALALSGRRLARDSTDRPKSRLAASATRFSTWGLSGVVLDVMILATLLGLRWVLWG